jgi:hypothetical protein
MEGSMYISDEDYDNGIDVVREKVESILRNQAEYVDAVTSFQDDAAINYEQITADLHSRMNFLTGMEALQAKQMLLMAESLHVIQNQLATVIKLLKDLNEVSLDTNVVTHYIEINTNLIEDNTNLTEQNTKHIEQNTRKR